MANEKKHLTAASGSKKNKADELIDRLTNITGLIQSSLDRYIKFAQSRPNYFTPSNVLSLLSIKGAIEIRMPEEILRTKHVQVIKDIQTFNKLIDECLQFTSAEVISPSHYKESSCQQIIVAVKKAYEQVEQSLTSINDRNKSKDQRHFKYDIPMQTKELEKYKQDLLSEKNGKLEKLSENLFNHIKPAGHGSFGTFYHAKEYKALTLKDIGLGSTTKNNRH